MVRVAEFPLGGIIRRFRRAVVGSVVSGHEALKRGPSISEVPSTVKCDFWMFDNTLRNLSDVGLEQAVAFLNRVIPNGIVSAEPHEPAEREIVVQRLHRSISGRSERTEKMICRSEPRRSLSGAMEGRPIPKYIAASSASARKHLVDNTSHNPDRMPGWDARLDVHVREQ